MISWFKKVGFLDTVNSMNKSRMRHSVGLSLSLYAVADKAGRPAFRQHNSACHNHQN
jgi:hypothetical protein